MTAPKQMLLPQWADVQCPNGDTFRVQITHDVMTDRIGNTRSTKLRVDDVYEAFQQHLRECRWLNADVVAADIFEIHPVGTMVAFDNEVYLVGLDGLWRNKYGQVPAGQVATPPDSIPWPPNADIVTRRLRGNYGSNPHTVMVGHNWRWVVDIVLRAIDQRQEPSDEPPTGRRQHGGTL